MDQSARDEMIGLLGLIPCIIVIGWIYHTWPVSAWTLGLLITYGKRGSKRIGEYVGSSKFAQNRAIAILLGTGGPEAALIAPNFEREPADRLGHRAYSPFMIGMGEKPDLDLTTLRNLGAARSEQDRVGGSARGVEQSARRNHGTSARRVFKAHKLASEL